MTVRKAYRYANRYFIRRRGYIAFVAVLLALTASMMSYDPNQQPLSVQRNQEEGVSNLLDTVEPRPLDSFDSTEEQPVQEENGQADNQNMQSEIPEEQDYIAFTPLMTGSITGCSVNSNEQTVNITGTIQASSQNAKPSVVTFQVELIAEGMSLDGYETRTPVITTKEIAPGSEEKLEPVLYSFTIPKLQPGATLSLKTTVLTPYPYIATGTVINNCN